MPIIVLVHATDLPPSVGQQSKYSPYITFFTAKIFLDMSSIVISGVRQPRPRNLSVGSSKLQVNYTLFLCMLATLYSNNMKKTDVYGDATDLILAQL